MAERLELDRLIDINEIDLTQLIFWNDKLKKEINERIKDTICPSCYIIIGTIESKYCPHCGENIMWIWEE